MSGTLANGDSSAWDELITHAFERLVAQCGRIIGQQLSRPHPLITENAVAAEVHQRLRKAMEADNVQPKTAREFFGLAARNIRWQIQDMLRKRTEQQGDTSLFAQLTAGTGAHTPAKLAQENEQWELFWKTVDQFTDDEREVFDLIWIHGLSQYAAADTIGKTRNQVDSIWRRVKMKIAKACKDYASPLK